ncbi:MAG: hypothetical protein AB1832_02315 [Pseudomonadota bacterium]
MPAMSQPISLSLRLLATCCLGLCASAPPALAAGPDQGEPPSAASVAQATQALEAFMKLPPDVRADCMASGFGLMTLPLDYMRIVDAKTLGDSAHAIRDAREKLHAKRLKDDFQTIASRVSQHGGDALKDDAVMNAALADVDAWQHATCPHPPRRKPVARN